MPVSSSTTPVPPATIPAEQRQLNLLHALRHSHRGLTAVELLESVEGYEGNSPSQRRKFERDKDVLRELGITIRTEPEGAAAEGLEVRYRVEDGGYTLAPLRLDAAQAQVLALAARSWQEGRLPSAARRAVTKLLAVAEAAEDAGGPQDLSLSVDPSLPTELVDAVDQQQLVAFDYTSPSSGRVSCRTVEPHALELREGRWYLLAVETGSRRELTFRVERISGPVTPLSAPRAFTTRTATAPPEHRRALLALRPGKGLALRGAASRPLSPTDLPAAPGPVVQGRDLLELTYQDRDQLSLAGLLASLGPDVLVLEPPALREAVRTHLRAVASLGPRGATDPAHMGPPRDQAVADQAPADQAREGLRPAALEPADPGPADQAPVGGAPQDEVPPTTTGTPSTVKEQ